MTAEQRMDGAPSGALVVSGADIVAAARLHIGAPWRHQGRSLDGMDCLGHVILAAHSLALTGFDTRDYARQASDESMLQQCREHLIEVGNADARPGDVPVMRFGANRHIGILGDYLHGGLSLIHASSMSPRRVVEHRFDDDWLRAVRAQWLATFRFPGVTP